MAPSIKLTYFDMKGRAESVRLAFTIGDVEFEDERIAGPEFQERREKGTFPFKSLPAMTVDGETYAESDGLLRYAGKLSGLYPECAKAAMKVDMVVSVLETIISSLFKSNTSEARSAFVNETIPRYVGAINDMYKKSDGPYLIGDKLSIADLKVYCTLIPLNDAKTLDHVPAGTIEEYKALMKMFETLTSLEKVKEWNAAHA